MTMMMMVVGVESMMMCAKHGYIVATQYQKLAIFYSQALGTTWLQRGCIWHQFYLHIVTHLQHCVYYSGIQCYNRNISCILPPIGAIIA